MAPPELPGFEHLRLIGSGGYSDVFLYNQQMPRRPVAIKVLLSEALGAQSREQFFAEANAMASVSTHPYIVSVFHAEVSSAGHPYLVMEYYPRGNFSVRAREDEIPVSEVLRIGVQVSSAVETAHRAGILHRDIKPANILISEYDRPGLTDFGIATAAGDGSEAEGMSVPWSPPEVVNGSAAGDATADVYSLAATIYTLLAGRSPYEERGGSNRTFDLMQRIEQGAPPPTGRADVPESLERLLRHGMARNPLDRPGSPLELARMLQDVEVEQGWAATQLEVRQDAQESRPRREPDDEDGTRLKGPVVIRSQRDDSSPQALVSDVPGTAPAGTSPPAGQTDQAVAHEGTVKRGAGDPAAAPIVDGVGARPVGLSGHAGVRPVRPMPSEHVRSTPEADSAAPLVGPPTGARPRRKRPDLKVLLGVLACAVLALVLLGVAFSGGDDCPAGSDDPDCAPSTTGLSGPDGPDGPDVPPIPVVDPTNVNVIDNGDGKNTITWVHEGQNPSDFEYRLDAVGVKASEVVSVADDSVTVDSVADPEVLSAVVNASATCWEVTARSLESGLGSDPSDAGCQPS